MLATIDREQLEGTPGLAEGLPRGDRRWSQWHEVIQVGGPAWCRHGIVEYGRDVRVDWAKPDLLPLAQAAAEDIGFVADQATVLRSGVERLIAGPEILESLFGNLKNLEQQQSQSGLTGLMLAMGAMVPPGRTKRSTRPSGPLP